MCNNLETIYHFVSNYDLKNERNIHFSKMKKQNILILFDNTYSKSFRHYQCFDVDLRSLNLLSNNCWRRFIFVQKKQFFPKLLEINWTQRLFLLCFIQRSMLKKSSQGKKEFFRSIFPIEIFGIFERSQSYCHFQLKPAGWELAIFELTAGQKLFDCNCYIFLL